MPRILLRLLLCSWLHSWSCFRPRLGGLLIISHINFLLSFSRTLSICLLLVLSMGLVGCSHFQNDESAVEAAGPAGPPSTLYERLGGEEALTTFSDKFVQQLALNNKIMSNPIVAGALSKSQTEHKQKLALLLCQITSGPCRYSGRSLKNAHAGLKITSAEWKEMTRIFIQVLQSMKVAKKERQELARLVAKYKKQIVGS